MIFRHPGLSDARLEGLMAAGRDLALRELVAPPRRFLALLDAAPPRHQDDDDEGEIHV